MSFLNKVTWRNCLAGLKLCAEVAESSSYSGYDGVREFHCLRNINFPFICKAIQSIPHCLILSRGY
jgi:hypothetical protein